MFKPVLLEGGVVWAGALEVGVCDPSARGHWMNLVMAMAARYMPAPNTA